MDNNDREIKLISESGSTARLIIRDSVLEECNKLQELNESSDYIAKWVGWKTPKDYVLKAMEEGNLPPEGKKEFFKLMTICLKEPEEIIGVLELYHGYPTVDTLCIGWIYISRQQQKHGYAREVFNFIVEEAREAGFGRIMLGAHLKNWPALRFWHKVGFDRIAGFIGDEEHSDEANATVLLEYSIR